MISQLKPEEAARVLEADPTAVYLDVRTMEEYQAGHAGGAWNVPVVFFGPGRQPVPNEEFERVVQAALPKEKKLVVGCQSGVRSMRACEILQRLGFKDVSNLAGGFGGARDSGQIGWRDSGLPVESGNPAERSYEELLRKA